jgi:hypothetical protein
MERIAESDITAMTSCQSWVDGSRLSRGVWWIRTQGVDKVPRSEISDGISVPKARRRERDHDLRGAMDAGYFIVEILSQALWREDSLAVAQGCHDGAVEVLESV